ncbi:SxtJ family membrane protein [Candidatus Neomarinimicrobiota bacterium]
MFGLLFPWYAERPLPTWPWITAAALIFASWALPSVYKYFHWLLSTVSKALGWLNSRIILGVIFYVIFTPMGVVIKLFGGLNLGRNFEPATVTYHKASTSRPIKHMGKPF